jgi:hypothetical protein
VKTLVHTPVRPRSRRTFASPSGCFQRRREGPSARSRTSFHLPALTRAQKPGIPQSAESKALDWTGWSTWQPLETAELFVAAPDESVWAICSRGRLLRASPEDWSWSSALPSDADVGVKALVFTTR